MKTVLRRLSRPPRAPRGLFATVCGSVLALCIVFVSAPTAFAIEPGEKAPDFSAARLEGSGTLGLSDYKGKVVYLDFWASWCAPCLKAVPALETLREEFPASKFQILAVNLDKKTKKALKFLAKQSVGYPSVSNPRGDIPGKFDLETMPSSYLIDQNGVVRYVHKGFRDGDLDVIRKEVRRIIR